MHQWPKRIISSIAILVAVPIGVEFLVSYIEGGQYSASRAGVVFGGILSFLLLIGTLRLAIDKIFLVLEFSVLGIGITEAVVGAFLLAVKRPAIGDGLDIAVISFGILTFALIGLALYVDYSGVAFFVGPRQEVAIQAVRHFNSAQHSVMMTGFPSFRQQDEEVAALSRESLSANDLHFIGYFINGRCRFHVDVLDEASLNRFFRGSSREDRRRTYVGMSQKLDAIVRNLNTHVSKLEGGILIRIVLDVEQGALYYCRIDKDVYITAVTMDQSRVLMADEKLRRLANSVGLLPRGGAYEMPVTPAIRQVESPEVPNA